MAKVLILGAGFGGLETATGLAAAMGDNHDITLIDKNDSFFIGFSKIDVLFGRRTETEVRYRYNHLRAHGVTFVQDVITSINTSTRRVTTANGAFDYDYLVVALGADLDSNAIPGFVDSGGHEFYSMAGVQRLRPVVEQFASGTLVLGIFTFPYKCPPAPYEVLFQLHDHFVDRGVRDDIQMKVVIPKPRPVGNPKVSDTLERLLQERQIELIPNTTIASIDPHSQCAIARDTSIAYDLFMGVPVHVVPRVVKDAGLADRGFVMPSPDNLETAVPNVYAIGDVSKIPVAGKAVPKAGAFAEDAARTVVSDILLKEGLVSERRRFEARGACYFEFGKGHVAKVNADYLSGSKPKVVLDGPDVSLLADKHLFETSRRERWFDIPQD